MTPEQTLCYAIKWFDAAKEKPPMDKPVLTCSGQMGFSVSRLRTENCDCGKKNVEKWVDSQYRKIWVTHWAYLPPGPVQP